MKKLILAFMFVVGFVQLNRSYGQANRYIIDPVFRPPSCILLTNQIFLDEKDRLNVLCISWNDPCLAPEYGYMQGRDFQMRFNRLHRKTGAYDMSFDSPVGKGSPQGWKGKILYDRARYFSLFLLNPLSLHDNGAIVAEDWFPDSVRLSGFQLRDVCETKDSGYVFGGNIFIDYPDGRSANILAGKLNKDHRVDTTFYSPRIEGMQIGISHIEPYEGYYKYLFCGSFPYWETMEDSSRAMVRVFADGREDTSFHSPFRLGGVYKCKFLQDGKILITGSFYFKDYPDMPYDTNILQSPTYKIARLHPDGQLDTTFRLQDYNFGGISDFHVFENGNILIVGVFASYQSKPRGSIALLDRDGALLDTHFTGKGFKGYYAANPDALSSINNILVVQDTLYIGGRFQSYDGIKTSSTGIIKLIPERNRHTPVGPPVLAHHKIQPSDLPFWEDPRNLEYSLRDLVNIYPNPVDDILTVERSGGISELKIIRINSGEILRMVYDHSNVVQLSTADLTPGVYLLSVTGQDGSVDIKRFIKK
jgi:hypothetical protein